jgi:hypothetical protein
MRMRGLVPVRVFRVFMVRVLNQVLDMQQQQRAQNAYHE